MKRIPLTQDMTDRLVAEKKRTNVGFVKLLQITPDVPSGLTAPLMESWARGKVRTVNETLFEFAITAYATLADNLDNAKRPIKGGASRIAVTDEMRQTIAAIWITLSPQALRRADTPKGLTASAIKHVIGSGDRRDNTIRKDWWEFLNSVGEWDAQEVVDTTVAPDLIGAKLEAPCDIEPAGRIPNFPGTEYAEINEAVYYHLHSEIRRTRVSPKRLLSSLSDAPKGLTHGLVGKWLRGVTRAAERRYLDYLIFHYRQLPSIRTIN